MIRYLRLLPVAIFAACASTSGVVQIGPETYSITGHDNGPAASLTSLKADIYRSAGAFCTSEGKTVKVTGGADTPRSFGQFPQTEVQSTCV